LHEQLIECDILDDPVGFWKACFCAAPRLGCGLTWAVFGHWRKDLAEFLSQFLEINNFVGGEHHHTVAAFGKEDDHLSHLLSSQAFGRGNFAGRK
jgi:hypothetical protein